MQIRTYLEGDQIIVPGQHDTNFYFVLEGNLLVYGMDCEYLGFLKPGSHIYTDYEGAIDNKMIMHVLSG